MGKEHDRNPCGDAQVSAHPDPVQGDFWDGTSDNPDNPVGGGSDPEDYGQSRSGAPLQEPVIHPADEFFNKQWGDDHPLAHEIEITTYGDPNNKAAGGDPVNRSGGIIRDGIRRTPVTRKGKVKFFIKHTRKKGI